MNKLPCVVTIAGTDPSGGAGIQADIKAISATGAYAASIITALVAQNTQGVQTIEKVSPAFVRQQMHSVFNDLTVDAIKIGMLHSEKIISTVASQLNQLEIKKSVLDPVMVAKDGSILLDSGITDVLKQQLFGLVYLVTPNIWEMEHLLGIKIHTTSDMELAAITLGQQFKTNILLKGGHLGGKHSPDVLYKIHENNTQWFEGMRIATRNTHGTGCTLSSAIASFLAQSEDLGTAIKKAKSYLSQAIASGARYSVGSGNGPVDHFYFLENRIR